MEEAERVVAPEEVCVGEADAEPVGDTVGAGIRVRVPVTVPVREGRRVTVPHEVDVAERVCGPVTEPEAVPVSVKVPFGVPVILRESGAVGVSALQRVGVAEVVCVLDCAELRVGLVLIFLERDCGGEDVPVFEGAILRVRVPDAVVERVPTALRVPVGDTVDVFD